MFSIKSLGKASAGADAYYSDLGRDDYYVKGGEPPGVWLGKGRHLLGLSGVADKEQIRALMQGYHPTTGEPLVQGAGPEHRAGWDFTLSAPKSASVLWAQADPEIRAAIEAAQLEAVQAAIKYVEEELIETRRGKGGQTKERPVGLVAVGFAHGSSRAADPATHHHILAFNLAPRNDGTFGGLEPRRVYQAQHAIDAVYKAAYARGLESRLGVKIERDERAFRVAGVPQSVEKAFSQRRETIQAEMERRGVSGSKAAEKICLETREAKKARPRAELFEEWQERGRALGFGPDQAAKLIDPDRRAPKREAIDTREILRAATAKEATFSRETLVQLVGEALQTGRAQSPTGDVLSDIRAEIERAMSDPELVTLPALPGEDPRFTTRTMLDMEQDLVARAQRLASVTRHNLTDEQIDRAIAKKEEEASRKVGRPVSLTDEQRAAVRHVCQSGGIGVYQGSAGAGKSFSAETLKIAYEARGYTLIGACTSKKAASNLQGETGIESHTNAALLHRLDNGQITLTRKSLVVIDEAGMASATDIAALLRHVEKAGAKLVLTGEDKQLDAVTHGGVLRHLSRDHVVGTARIEAIVRQREEWAREAVTDLREGRADRALAAYDSRGLVHLHKGAEATRTALVDAWKQYHADNPAKKSVILATRNEDVRAISATVRAYLQATGAVGREDIELKTKQQNETVTLAFARGDRIKFGRNDPQLGGSGVMNGTLATVESVRKIGRDDARFTVVTDDGRRLTFNASNYIGKDENDKKEAAPALSHAYALTVFASQGITVDGDVFVYGAGDRALSYVAASRAKDNARFYIDAAPFAERAESDDRADILTEVAKAMTRDTRKKMAIEHIEEHAGRLAIQAHADMQHAQDQPTPAMIERAEHLHHHIDPSDRAPSAALPTDYRESFTTCRRYIEDMEQRQERDADRARGDEREETGARGNENEPQKETEIERQQQHQKAKQREREQELEL